LQNEVDANEWEEAIESMQKVRDPKEQLEELCIGIIDLTWEQVLGNLSVHGGREIQLQGNTSRNGGW